MFFGGESGGAEAGAQALWLRLCLGLPIRRVAAAPCCVASRSEASGAGVRRPSLRLFVLLVGAAAAASELQAGALRKGAEQLIAELAHVADVVQGEHEAGRRASDQRAVGAAHLAEQETVPGDAAREPVAVHDDRRVDVVAELAQLLPELRARRRHHELSEVLALFDEDLGARTSRSPMT